MFVRNWLNRSAVLAASLCVLVLPSFTLVAEPVFVSPSAIKIATLSSGKSYACVVLNGRMSVGTYQAQSSLFYPLKDKLSSLKAKAKKARGSARTKLNKSVAKLQSQISLALRACNKAGGGTTPEVPTPTPSPTPSNSNPSSSCFIGSETTCFGIPFGMAGSKTRGQSLYSANCGDCHEAKTGSYYSVVRDACKGNVSEMSSVCGNFSSQNLADLTAYLNRNN